MRKTTRKLFSLLLTLALILPIIPSNIYAEVNAQATTGQHNKQVIGYITQWDAWKDAKAGVPAQGALTHLNIDYSKYTILNYSFFGVANDGSLHSGDFRNKNIYQPGVEQQPAPLLYTDVYSSWDLYILYGEMEPLFSINADAAARARAQGFEVEEWGNTWSNASWGVTNQPLPLPLKKEGGAPGLLEMAKQNGVKVMASIGGWSMCKHFGDTAANPTMRAKFIADVKRLMAMGFDGIDLDWEYPGPFDGMNFTGKQVDYANFITLIKEIRQAIGGDKLITSCFSASTARIDSFDWKEIDKYLDYYNFMTYDYNGGWSDIAGHNSPLYSYSGAEAPQFNWNDLYEYLKAKGVNMSKVNMGAPFYGRGVITKDAAGLNAPTLKRTETVQPDGPITTCADYTNWPKEVYDGTPNYFYVKQTALKAGSGWTKHWDDEAKVPYLTKGNFFLSYDDEESIGHKAQYIKDKNLAGVIIWTVYGDLEFGGTVTNYGTKLKKWSNMNSPLVNKINAVFADGTTPIQTVATPTFSPVGGTYTSAQNVTIATATAGATIRYTLDGTTPTASSPEFSNAITVSSTTTLKAKAFKAGMNASATATANYIIGDDNPIGTVATPVFSPASGTYTSAQTVTITTATDGAKIRYTTNGTEPTANSSEYSNAINVAATTTLKAKAFKAGMNDSATATATYTITTSGGNDTGNPNGAPAMPQLAHNNWDGNASYTITFNIWWGNNATSYKLYENNVVVDSGSLTANSPNGQSKVFNINNKSNGTYTYKIELTNSFGTTTSGVASVNVTKGSTNPIQTVATPTFNPASGTYTSAQSVTISTATADATIRYTTNGTEPTANSPAYTGAINVASTTTVKAKAFKTGMNDSATATAVYTIVDDNPVDTVATPIFNPAGGTYTSAQSVTIATPTAGATIRYTTNGSEPTASSQAYNGAINVAANTTLKAKAFKAGLNDSATATASYVITIDNPTNAWAPYTAYKQGDIVSYNGNNYSCRQPHTSLPGWEPSNVPALWLLSSGTVDPIQTVATPSFAPGTGSYTSAQYVAISTATAGAEIRYTTDGTEPTANSTLYNGTVYVASNTTLKAKAFKAGMNNSATATASYVINNPIQTVATPTISATPGTAPNTLVVSMNTTTADAAIRYTTNGTEPTSASTLFNGAITIAATTTFKAKAFKSGMTDSATATSTFTIGGGNVTGKKVVGYYPSWEPNKLDRIQYDVLTHINYAFAIPTSDATILPLESPQTASTIISQAHANNVKVLIAVGGWSYNGTPLENTFVQATNTDAKIAKLTGEIMNVVNQFGFDGVDMDWEHPRTGAASAIQYQKLMVSLRNELNKSGKLLTSAVLAGVTPDGNVLWDAQGHTDIALGTCDFINVMAYDGGDGERHSSYSFAVNSANYWKNTRNLGADKVILGLPFYGRPSWASYDAILQANPNAYNTDISMINGLQAYYNGIPTIKQKTTWAKQNVGGVMMWEISQDTLDRSKSLLSAIGEVIN